MSALSGVDILFNTGWKGSAAVGVARIGLKVDIGAMRLHAAGAALSLGRGESMMASIAEHQHHKPWSMTRVIVASSAGTAFEWYDFFIFGSLAQTISKVFFAGLDPTAALIAALGLFAAGFAFRPLGAIIFGVVGDRLGRKGAFLVTVSLMGAATFAIGLLPTYASAGALAPALLIFLRILQGIALGGEYGGAAIYVAEHAPNDRRGAATGWIQSSASFGLLGRAAGDPRDPHRDRRGRVRRLGLAGAVPDVDLPARHLGVDAGQAGREPGVRRN